MLKDAPIMAVLPAQDMDRAEKFYADTLGFEELRRNEDGGIIFASGEGSRFLVYPTQFAGTARNTAASFIVDDIEAVADDLRGRGIEFEDYDMGPLKTENGIATFGDVKAAWFIDPEGNIVALTQPARVPA